MIYSKIGEILTKIAPINNSKNLQKMKHLGHLLIFSKLRKKSLKRGIVETRQDTMVICKERNAPQQHLQLEIEPTKCNN